MFNKCVVGIAGIVNQQLLWYADFFTCNRITGERECIGENCITVRYGFVRCTTESVSDFPDLFKELSERKTL